MKSETRKGRRTTTYGRIRQNREGKIWDKMAE